MSDVIEKVGLCLVREGRLLLARNHGAEVFQIPGGKIEATDPDAPRALVREIQEELGLTLDPDTAVCLGQFSAPAAGKPGKTVRVSLFNAPITGQPAAQGEIAELLWHDLAGPATRPMSAVVTDKILPFLTSGGTASVDRPRSSPNGIPSPQN